MSSRKKLAFVLLGVFATGAIAPILASRPDYAGLEREWAAMRQLGYEPQSQPPDGTDVTDELSRLRLHWFGVGLQSSGEDFATSEEGMASVEAILIALPPDAITLHDSDWSSGEFSDVGSAVRTAVMAFARRAEVRSRAGDVVGALADLRFAIDLERLYPQPIDNSANFSLLVGRQFACGAVARIARERPDLKPELLAVVESMPDVDWIQAEINSVIPQRETITELNADDWSPIGAYDYIKAFGFGSFVEYYGVFPNKELVQAEIVHLRGLRAILERPNDNPNRTYQAITAPWRTRVSWRLESFESWANIEIFPEKRHLLDGMRTLLGVEGLVDRYGHPFQTDGTDVWSAGEDGLQGSGDDVRPLDYL